MKGRSTTTNLTVFTKFVFDSFSSYMQVDTIYTDFAKTFDRVPHNVLLAKLDVLGFHSTFLAWMRSYLENRHCYVCVDGHLSNPFIATSGVPQGSILGPLLFILFINDIGNNFSHCKYLLYADDLKIFYQVSSTSDMALVQVDLNRLMQWCDSNKLFLNVNKCYYMSFARTRSIFPSAYNLNNCNLSRVYQIRDLGVTFDPGLTFVNHLNYIIPKAYKSLAFIRRHIRYFKDPHTMKSLYFALVRSQLEYAVLIWNPYYAVHALRLERVQKAFTRLALRPIFKKDHLPEYNSRNLLLGIKTLETRRVFLSFLFIFDIINGSINCPCLLETITFAVPTRILRHSNLFLFQSFRTRHASNEPIARNLDLINRFSADHSFDFSTSKYGFKNFLNEIL